MCTINRRPIYARFHFMDGQFHAVEFDPSATAAEVLKLVKAKIGLRETAKGYAIYEVLGQQERSLLQDEKVADVMSKWEKYRAAGGTLSRQSRHHMFLFKKHLFLDEYIDLTDSVEKELLYYQVNIWLNISLDIPVGCYSERDSGQFYIWGILSHFKVSNQLLLAYKYYISSSVEI